MNCYVCGLCGPDKFSRDAHNWDWFTGYLTETVHFCPSHIASPQRKELWEKSKIRALASPAAAKSEGTEP